MNTKELIDRLAVAKRFLQTEMTHIKLNDGRAVFAANQVLNSLDAIREVERTGVTRLGEIQAVRIERVLTSVESQMKLHKN
ncbi:MAG: hypothetical protein KF690_03835 [Bacteroidetes bacterium]|nr:hypothetical protein [Bacteroidota bacterium]